MNMDFTVSLHPGPIHRRTENLGSHKNLPMNVYSSSLHNLRRLGTAKCPWQWVDDKLWYINKCSVAHWIKERNYCYTQKRGWFFKGITMNESSQFQRWQTVDILYDCILWHSRKGKTIWNGNKSLVARNQVWERVWLKRGNTICTFYIFIFWGDVCVLYPDCGDG